MSLTHSAFAYSSSLGTVARRVSIHRATTVGAKSPLCQVILKNTATQKESSTSISKGPLNRSKSLLTTNTRTPVLAPSRGERARLEALLSDVWSRTVLPFPGINGRSKSEHHVRNSATTMMRKLSVAHITGSLSKRSASVTSMTKANNNALSHIDVDASDTKNSDGSSCTSAPDELANPNRVPPLPSIRDRSEGINRHGLTTYEEDDNSLSGTVRKVDLSRHDIPWSADDDGMGGPPLRESPAHDFHTGRQPPPSLKSESSMSSISPEKENLQRKPSKHERFLQAPLAGMKSPRKWSKVGSLNKGTKSSGLRSFFQ